MVNILIHGLGQNDTSWDVVEKELKNNNIKVEKPNLYFMMSNSKKDYNTLYREFSNYCDRFNGKLNLCGLSLGGILAVDYVKEHHDKVNSLILIGTPYKIPKFLFKVQGLIFKTMSKSIFEKIGCEKKDFISLVNSMRNLDIKSNLEKITCKTLILCGIKDSQNLKSAKLLNKSIKNSSFKTIDNSSHEVNVDNPKELTNVIYDFWKDRGN